MSTPIDAFGDELKRRMENPFWGSFIIAWLVINWKVVLVILSWSSEKIDDKIIYIEKLFLFDGISSSFISIWHLLIFPLLASFMAVWFVPILAREYLKKHRKNKNDDESKMEEIQSKMGLIKAKVDLQKKENEFENSQEKIWDEEYDEILKSGIIPIVVRFIFEENGQNYISSSGKKYLDTYTLATATKYDLITEISQREYSLTDKGKYILKQYPSENLKSDLNPF